MKNLKKILGVLIAVAAAVIGTCCGDKNPVNGPETNCKAKLSVGEQIEWNTASQFVMITAPADQKWTATIEDDWAWFDYEDYHYYTKGQGNGAVALYIASNGASTSRSTTIKVEFDGVTTITLKMTQGAFVQAEAPEIDYDKTNWPEMPQVKENDGNIYVTHMTKDNNNKTLRNYSMCYDPDVKAALWIAYPLHDCYTRKVVDRTDAWGYDPLIPAQYQVNMEKGMSNGYDRGHQVASADRVASRDMNVQTFYYTNMTAQVGAMNQGIWNDLENKIRNEYICRDTLYVVTGCVMTTEYDTQVKWVNNRNGGQVAVPKAYFKVLLRTKSGNTGKAVDNSNATTIGLWVENRSYGDEPSRASIVKSVDEIERLTGFTFFPQISDEVKETKDLARWGF